MLCPGQENHGARQRGNPGENNCRNASPEISLQAPVGKWTFYKNEYLKKYIS